jgi:hypothetical protein
LKTGILIGRIIRQDIALSYFGGLYHSGDFILQVQAQQKIENRSQEIMNIFYMLNEKAKEEFKYIWKVVIHNQNDEIDCESRNVVYEEESFS